MSTPTGSQGSGNDSNKSKSAPFTSPPSSRALALVGIAVLVGLLLVVVVNSDKNSNEKADSKSSSATTVSTTTETTAKKSSSTTSSTTTPVANTTKPSNVSVLVLNGSNIAGVASTVSTEIGNLDYKTLTPGNDTSKDKGTYVYYKTGFQNDAKQLATNVVPGLLSDLKISQPVKTQPFPSSAPVAWDQQNLVSANVVIVVGNPS